MATIRENVTMKILVAYATRHGATRGIAERIAATLEGTGFDVTLRSVDTAGPIEEFGACVIGSAAYLGGWLGEATSFVRRHREGAGRPTRLAVQQRPDQHRDGRRQGTGPAEGVRAEGVRGVRPDDPTQG